MQPLPEVPNLSPIRNVAEAERMIRTLLLYLAKLKRAIET